MSTAADLRRRAALAEQREEERAIKRRCRFDRVEWSSGGLAYALFHEFQPCPGYAGRKHAETYEDEYGTRHHCPGCSGNGKIFVTHRLRRPQFDAPQPSKRYKGG